MALFTKHKHFRPAALAFVLLPLFLVVTTLNALAVAKPGCYSDYSGSPYQGTCGGTSDTFGQPIDSTKNCYIVSQDTTGKTQYQQVDCTQIISSTGHNACGSNTPPNKAVYTSIDLGCKGVGNPIIDMTFGIIRFLSYGVGFIVVASIVVAGIQYTTSQGDPQAAAKAEKRIKSTITALLIYIFAYAILNYVIPQGFLHQ